jgi:DNA-directed RNA polymerase I subunit RPA1
LKDPFRHSSKLSFLQRQLITEGSNLPAMWRIASDMIDVNKIDTNDIFAVLETYGVEAARASIIREVYVTF